MRAVVIVAIFWAVAFSYLAVSRHEAFESNAFDLGYVTQTLWNTAHGRPFVFTTVDGVPFSPEGPLNVDLLRRPHSLLAFHVEPILLLVAPVFAAWPDPRLLLIAQAVILATGAIGIAALAGRRVGGPIASVVFGVAYLLSPSVAAAAMSDFHAVTIAAALIPGALYLWSVGKNRSALGLAFLAALTREDAAILVAALGAYLFVRGETRPLPPAPSPTRGEGEQAGTAPAASRGENGAGSAAADRAELDIAPPLASTRLTNPLSLWERVTYSLSIWERLTHFLSLWERVRVRVVPGSRPTPTVDRRPAPIGIRSQDSPLTSKTASARPDPFDHLRRPGGWLLVGAGIWAIVAFGGIIPFFNGTFSALLRHQTAMGSVFWHRYEWLGATPFEAARNIFVDPHRSIDWFERGDVDAYFATLLLTGGVVAALAPDILAIALPIVLLNALSSFDWMRSGGAHYSVILVPVLLFAGIEGTRRISIAARWAAALGMVVVLFGSAANHIWLGASPAVPGLSWPTPDSRLSGVDRTLARVPADASVSATSAVYPHIASRDRAYWFPAVNDAEYVAIDAGSSTSPIGPRETRRRVDDLLSSGSYQLFDTASGFLLFKRMLAPDDNPASDFPDSFYDFARASPTEVGSLDPSSRIRFGDDLTLGGYRLMRVSSQTIFGPNAVITTYWQVDARVTDHLAFVFYVSRRSDSAMVGALPDAAPEPLWYPPYLWKPGETVRLTVTVPRVDDLQGIGVAVVGDAGSRLPIHASPDQATWENGTIARITRFDR